MDGIEFEETINAKCKAFHKSRRKILEKVKIVSVSFPIRSDFEVK